MSRYTIILIDQSFIGKHGAVSKDILSKTIEKYIVDCCYYTFLTPYLAILLSNGLSEKSHIDLFNELNTIYPGIKLVSVTHEVPMYAVYKALQVVGRTNFYYEQGVEEDYLIGYLVLEHKGADPLEDLVSIVNLLHNALIILLRGGSIPLHICLGGLITTLNKHSIDQLDLLRPYYRVNIVQYKNAKFVSNRIFNNM